MKISIKQYQHKNTILVRRISQKQRCEELCNKVIDRIHQINSELRSI